MWPARRPRASAAWPGTPTCCTRSCTWTRWTPQPCSAWAPTPTAGQHWPGPPQAASFGAGRVGPGGRPPSLAGPGLLTPLPGWGKPGQGSGPQGPRPPCPPAGPAPSLCEGPYHSLHLPPPPRNPDQDEKPWCYVLKDQALSWEYCRLAPCGACSWWPTSRRGRSAAPCGPPHPRPVPSLENLCPSERRGG